MKTDYLKSIFLVWAWIALATSFAIYAQPAQLWTSIQANLVNLVQYLESLHITSNGTPNGIQFIDIDGAQRTMSMQNDTLAFDFNSHNFAPFDYVWGLYNDGGWNVLLNGVWNPSTPMAVMSAISSDGDRIGISTRKQNGEVTAMMEYESTGNQDQAVQVQHQVKLKADGTTISFDDYDVLGSQTQLGLGWYWFYITSSSGAYMAMTRDGTFSLANYTFPLANGSEWQVLTSHSNGQLSWEDAAASDTVTTTVYLSSSDILSLGTTPFELIPAPQSNQINMITEMVIIYHFGTTPYYVWDNMMDWRQINVGYDQATNGSVYGTPWHASILIQNQDALNIVHPNTIIDDLASATGQPIKIKVTWNSPENGDGTLEIRITYKTIDAFPAAPPPA